MNKKNILFGSLVGSMIVGVGIGILTGPIVITEKNGTGVAAANNGIDATAAIEKASDAVIGVLNMKDGMEDSLVQTGSGSGVVYKKEDGTAYIFTNQHVIEGAGKVEISLENGDKIPAEVLGSDKITDLAVLKADSDKIDAVADLGNSEQLKRGETVYAIGSPLGLEFYGTVTRGIISATERAIPVDLDEDGVYDWQTDVVQTDAAINPGNSGGALINTDGEVIGINSIKIVENAVEGIGLAIPISTAKPVIDELETIGTVSRPYMGVEIRSLQDITEYQQDEQLLLPTSIDEGVCLLSVQQGSPAQKAGLKQYDVVIKVDEENVDNVIAFRKKLYAKEPKDKMEITYYREDTKQTATVTLAQQK